MSEPKKMQYYVLRTVYNKETEVANYIESMRDVVREFRDFVGEILVPMETTYVASQSAPGGRKEVIKPYHPGYVYVQAQLIGETRILLRNVPGVLGFLGFDEANPDVLNPMDIAEIKRRMDTPPDALDGSDLVFAVGERVKVIFGPFKDFFGEVTEVLPDRKRLKILVKVFGRETSMEVDFMQVEKESMP